MEKVPRYDKNPIVAVVDDENLDQVLDTCREDVFNPDVIAKGDLKVNCGLCKTFSF
jgi:hypothetical protein